MAKIEFDTSELNTLAADLTQAPAALEGKIAPVVEKGALNIKNQLVAEMRSSRSFKAVADAISYDIHGGQMFGGGIIEAEIGPVRGSPGSLANIAYFGGANGGGGTVADPQDALDAETPKFEQALGDLLEDLL